MSNEPDNETIRKALEGLYKLVEDGDLVRNITKDDDFVYFAHQGIRITKAIGAVQAVLAQATSGDMPAAMNDASSKAQGEVTRKLNTVFNVGTNEP